MRRVAVSAALTIVDVVLLVALAEGIDAPVALADAASVGAASVLSWVLHRGITFAGDRNVRWVRRPGGFAIAAVLAGSVDVLITSLGSMSIALVPAKLVGIVAAGALRLAVYRRILASGLRRQLGQRRPGAAPPGERRVTVVIPAKDEAARIAEAVRRVRVGFEDMDAEVLVVDDGSTDGTAGAAEAAGATVLRHEANRGKGAALRSGVLAARGRTVAFLDADLAYTPEQARALVDAVESGWDVAVGNRFDPESVVEGRSSLRYLGGRLFNAVTALVLLGQYRDTQCGCKAFRIDVARALFSRTKLDGFAIDVELLHLVEREGQSLVELPVTVSRTAGSTVNLRASLRAVGDLLRIRRWSRQGEYDASTA